MGRDENKPAAPRVARGKLIAGDREIHLTRLEELILWCLAARHPRRTKNEDIVYFCYGDREDGGPLLADEIIRVKISGLRQKLVPIGWEINPHYYMGYLLRKSPNPSKSRGRRR